MRKRRHVTYGMQRIFLSAVVGTILGVAPLGAVARAEPADGNDPADGTAATKGGAPEAESHGGGGRDERPDDEPTPPVVNSHVDVPRRDGQPEEPTPGDGPASIVVPTDSTARTEGSIFIAKVELEGTKRTRASTILDLLPRPAPAAYTRAEIEEFERRIRNLEIFDSVAVESRDGTLRVAVREKWTLIPSFDIATGPTLDDTFIAVGATEYNFLGTASQLIVAVSHEQRGWNFSLGYEEHAYRPNRWAVGAEAFYVTSGLRFDDSNEGWFRNQAGGLLTFTAPMPHGSFWSYRVGATYAREVSEDPDGTFRPPNGHHLGTIMTVVYDRYVWNDLVPAGWRATLTVSPGWFFGPRPAESRHRAELFLNGSLPLTRSTALIGRVVSGVNSTGNANFSMLLGSYSGVRGLEDALYRNWAQVYSNVELRQTIRFAERWAIQPVAFVDAAAFAQMGVYGQETTKTSAFGAGVGGRIIPTALAGLLFRVDVARLFYPYENVFVQLGTSQYF